MSLEPTLLAAVRTAMQNRVEAEAAVAHARTDEQLGLRRLQLAGGSVREIAKAIGISPQRVQQLIGAADAEAGGGGWKRKGRPPKADLLVCSFCQKRQKEVAKLIAGPSCFICNECAAKARTGFQPRPQCSFCTKKAQAELPVVGADQIAICGECLDLCDEIIANGG